jgi:hypothetical protein
VSAEYLRRHLADLVFRSYHRRADSGHGFVCILRDAVRIPAAAPWQIA